VASIKGQRIYEARSALRAEHEAKGVRRFNGKSARLALAAARERRSGDKDDHWLILTCAGPSTLRLARSLMDAGMEAWTPVGSASRRIHQRSSIRHEVETAIMPGVVFARKAHYAELKFVRQLPVALHPPFNIVSSERGLPLVRPRDAGLMRLRAEQQAQHVERLARIIAAEEAQARAAADKVRSVEQRQADEERRARKAERKHFDVGAGVQVDRAGFDGKTGLVVACNGAQVTVDYGGAFPVTFLACYVQPDPLWKAA
jgi:hypothetical protein